MREKMFGMFVDNHHGDGRVGLWCKAPPGVQAMLVEAAPKRFFIPPYVGHKGWIGVRLDGAVDWEEIADLVADSYRMTAPARLRAAFGDGSDAPTAPPKPRAFRGRRSARDSL